MADLVRVEGLSELQKILDGLPDKLERNIVRSALRAGLKGMKAEVEARIPVRTGKLRQSVKLKTKLVKGKPNAAVTVGNKEAWYAHLVEFGTGGNYQGTGKTVGGPYVIKAKNKKGLFVPGASHPVMSVTHPGSKAQPFMRPAFDAGNSAAIQAFVAKIKQRLTKQGIELPDEGDAA